MDGRYTIDSLKIEGFRGYLGKLTHSIHNSSSIIYGPQGSGKSSTLNAIEWCLFGKVAYFKSAESKSDAEIVNARASGREAKVQLNLVNGSEQIEIIRTKMMTSRETSLIVNFEGKTEEGALAQDLIYKALGLTYDDFYRAAYLHQESINALITDDPKSRDEAVDRLLGLERVRNILGSIPMQAIKKSLTDLTEQKEKMSAKLQGAIEQITKEVTKAEDDAKKAGFLPDQFTMVEISKRLSMLQSNFDKIATESKSEPFSMPVDLDTDVVAKMIPKMRTFMRNCRKKVIEVTGVDELIEKQNKAIQMKIDAEDLLKNKNGKEAEIRAIESEFGNIETIDRKIGEANASKVKLRRDRDELDARAKLAKDALYFFEDALISNCPLCGQKITYETTKKHLEEIIGETTGKRVGEIDSEITLTDNLIKVLTNKKQELVDLGREVENLLNQTAKLASKCSELAEKKVEFTEIIGFLDIYINALKNRIEESNYAFKIKNEHIESAETEIDGVQVINNVIQKHEEYQALERRSKEENEERKGLSQSIMEIEKFRDNLDTLVQSLNEIQISSAAESISQAQDKMAMLYARIMAHPYYNQLDISVTSKNVQGVQKNTYLIKARSAEEARDTYVSSRFSSGQLNCTALAIFLSLAEMSQNKIGFILLDDPSQSLDKEHVKGLSEVLAEFSESRQLIISTQDDNFYENLKSALSNNDTYNEITFLPWTKNGCQLAGGVE